MSFDMLTSFFSSTLTTDVLMSFLLFFGVSFLMVLASHVLVWRYFEDELNDVFDWVLLLFVVLTTSVMSVLAVIGFLGWLHFPGMIVGSLVFVGGVLFPSWFQVGSKKSRLGVRAASQRLRHLLYRQQKIRFPWWFTLLLVVFGGWMSVELLSSLVQYPWEYDSWAYHLPIMVEWMQSGSLWEVFYAVWGGPLGYYPAHHELLSMWLVLPFENDFFVNVPNFGLMLILLVAVAKFLRALQVSDVLAWSGGMIVMVMPMFYRQLSTGRVDLLMVLMLLLSFYYLLRSFQRRDGVLFFPVLFCMGLTLGVKYLSIIYIAPVLLVFLIMAKIWKKHTRAWFFWFLLVMGTLGSMWYWRNLLLTGNPVFPANISLGGTELLSGYGGFTERVQDLSLWARVSTEGQFFEWLDVLLLETGWHLYVILAGYVVVVVEVIGKLIWSHMKRGEGRIFVMMLFSLPVYWFLYFASPYTADLMQANARYGMPWLLMGIVLMVYVIHRLGRLWEPLLAALVVVLGYQAFLMNFAVRKEAQPFFDAESLSLYPQYLLVLFLLLGAVWGVAFLWRRRYPVWPVGAMAVVFLSSMVFAQMLPLRDDRRHLAWETKYDLALIDGFRWLDENIPDDATVATSFSALYYPVYGPQLARDAGYVNINSCGDCDYASYSARGMAVRDDADIDAWIANLRAKQVEYVFLGYADRRGLDQLEAYEFDWVHERPDLFELQFEIENGVEIYSFDSSSEV